MRPWLTSNAGLKVVAVVLAIFVWVFVKAANSDSRIVEGVPVEVKAPAGMLVAETSPSSVSVTVRGPTDDLRQVSRFELFCSLDLHAEGRTNGFQVVLRPRDVRHPRRVVVTAVDPTNIFVRLERNTE